MKQLFFLLAFFSITAVGYAQEEKLYHPEADAEKDLAAALKKAKAEDKFVLVQGGGNWCRWCIEFARVAKADQKVDSVINSSFVWYHLNYSKENENHSTFSRLGWPQRFGYPEFVILNEKGERVHIQNSEYLEDGKNSYNMQKVQSFLEMWSPRIFDPHLWGDEVKPLKKKAKSKQ